MKPGFLIIILVLICNTAAFSKEWVKVVDLSGKWKFKIGDEAARSEPDYNDSEWGTIKVPSAWENQGYHGYNGYGWYRKSFEGTPELYNKMLSVHLGYIDDVDEVYINGYLVGASGSFPPDFKTAYNAYRVYPVPNTILKTKGLNVIAVRVYDSYIEGGILSGNIGIFNYEDPLRPDYYLEGVWKFRTGDSLIYKQTKYNDGNWVNILVPGFWEEQRAPGYDGVAWYRKEFVLTSSLKNRKLVLLMGKIDDWDEVYLNGVKIGETGDIDKLKKRGYEGVSAYEEIRAYYIPPEILLQEGSNVLAVRVYDNFMRGGIYSGPVGLMYSEKFEKAVKERERKKTFWERLFGVLD